MTVHGRPHQPKCSFCKRALYKTSKTFSMLKNKKFSLCRNTKCKVYDINQQNLKNLSVSTSEDVEVYLDHFSVEKIHVDDVRDLIFSFTELENRYGKNVLYLLMFVFSKITNNKKILNVVLEEWDSINVK